MANDVSYFKIPNDNTQYAFNDADAETSITNINTALPKTINVPDMVIDGTGNVTIVVTVASGHRNRVPVLVGGNVSNNQFLRLYQIDMAGLTSSLAEQTRYEDLITFTRTVTVSANLDGGDSSKLRIRVANIDNVYSHFFILPLVSSSLISIV